MQLTSGQQPSPHLRVGSRPGTGLSVVWLGTVAVAVFALDRGTGLPHVQHLYYVPIVFAAMRFGMVGGAAASLAAIALYHLANPQTLTWQHEESDVLQMAVFVAVGIVAARLADDARRLHRLAMTDDLTGLHNLRSFELELKAMLRAAHTAGADVSLLVLDVDRLKSLNDEHGHLAGAEAVRTVGRIVAERIPADAVACRYGGDEFVVALPYGAAAARHVADDLRQAVLARAPVLAGVHFPAQTLSISIGLACRAFNNQGRRADHRFGAADDGEPLFRMADAALYAAKAGGRNRVHVA